MSETTQQVAETIVQQMGGRVIFAMAFTGSSPCDTAWPEIGATFARGGVVLHVAPALKRQAYVAVSLDADDTYTVRYFTAHRGGAVKVLGGMEGVYCDSLRGVVESLTGFALTLGRVRG